MAHRIRGVMPAPAIWYKLTPAGRRYFRPWLQRIRTFLLEPDIAALPPTTNSNRDSHKFAADVAAYLLNSKQPVTRSQLQRKAGGYTYWGRIEPLINVWIKNGWVRTQGVKQHQ